MDYQNLVNGGFIDKASPSNDLTTVNAGGTHSTNPNNGVPIGPSTKVEEGETLNNAFVFSQRIILDKNMIEKYKLPKKYSGKSIAEVSKLIDKDFTRENDPYEQRAKQQKLDNLKMVQEAVKSENPDFKDSSESAELMPLGGLAAGLMVAPAITEGVNLVRTATNKPEEVDRNIYDTNFSFDANLVNRDQIKRDINSQDALAGYSLKNASGGNAGTFLSNRLALNTNTQNALSNANLQADLADSQELARIEGLQYDQELRNRQNQANVDNINAANIAQYESMIQDSIANIGQSIGNVGLTAFRSQLLDGNNPFSGGRIKSSPPKDTLNPTFEDVGDPSIVSDLAPPPDGILDDSASIEGNYLNYLKAFKQGDSREAKLRYVQYLRNQGKNAEANDFVFSQKL